MPSINDQIKNSMKVMAGCILVLLFLLIPLQAYAHGTDLSYTLTTGIEITALYDSGQPMVGGQVSVFTPDEPIEPWITGLCDEQGKFFFVPDYSLPGLWEVQVRQAGHGDIIRIEVAGDETVVANGSASLTLAQKLLIALTVVWAAIGTALYFSRGKN